MLGNVIGFILFMLFLGVILGYCILWIIVVVYLFVIGFVIVICKYFYDFNIYVYLYEVYSMKEGFELGFDDCFDFVIDYECM